MQSWLRSLYDLIRPGKRRGRGHGTHRRGAVTHVIILDGTTCSLDFCNRSNAGLAYQLINAIPRSDLSIFYEAGLQWQDWRATGDIIRGRGINRQIARAYGYLASRYRPGDRIFLFGYSRGAFAVRSLAGVMDRVGLLQADHATERNIVTAYRHYRALGQSPALEAFRRAYCHAEAPIEMVGVWDTVKSLGLRLPIIWRWTEPAYAFHNHALGSCVRHGYHALALNETRRAYAPVMWQTPEGFQGDVQQVWFRGTHRDVGGQLEGQESARPLANIPFVWMMEKADALGLGLPDGWQQLYPTDATAPKVGNWRGWGKLFLLRAPRRVGADPSEYIHPTAIDAPDAAETTDHHAAPILTLSQPDAVTSP